MRVLPEVQEEPHNPSVCRRVEPPRVRMQAESERMKERSERRVVTKSGPGTPIILTYRRKPSLPSLPDPSSRKKHILRALTHSQAQRNPTQDGSVEELANVSRLGVLRPLYAINRRSGTFAVARPRGRQIFTKGIRYLSLKVILVHHS